MVLFREDEKRIKQEEKAAKKAKRSRVEVAIRRCFKIFLIITSLFFVGITLLSFLGGNSAALKKGVEDYLTQETAMKAEIGIFHHMKFFPQIEISAENIKFSSLENDDVKMTVDMVGFSASFFDMMFSRQRFSQIELQNLKLVKDVIGTAPLQIKEINLKENAVGEDSPGLIVKGKYGERDISASLTMNMEMKNKKPVFIMQNENKFSISYGAYKASGKTKKLSLGGVNILLTDIDLKGQKFNAAVDYVKGFGESNVKGDLSFGKSNAELDVTFAPNVLKGDIDVKNLYQEDIPYITAVQNFINELPSTNKSRLINYNQLDLDLETHIEHFYLNGVDMGNIKTETRIEEEVLSSDITGEVNKGKVSGKLKINAKSLPAKMNLEGNLKNWHYAEYQKIAKNRQVISGKADVKLALSSEAKTYEGLKENLKGNVALIAGEAELESKALNIWGVGLVNALMPNLSDTSMTHVNCAIADFKIEDKVAKPQALFLDTKRLTLSGEGEIYYLDNKIDITLEPKAKNPSLLDVTPSVRIEGSITKPSIGADNFSLLRKIGGLALGFVNPAFLAFTLTDFGLTESHPCYKFLEEETE